MEESEADLNAIKVLIERQFSSLSWAVGGGPDMIMFKSDFLPSAPLHPAARPVKVKSLDEFTERMGEAVRTTLTSLHERAIGMQILAFGNVAVAAAVCETTENQSKVNRAVEMLLLVKSGGEWKIAAQAWDNETSSTPIPDELPVHR